MSNNNYKGYSLFNDVESKSLRTYNRCVTATNIKQARGEQAAKDYMERFSELERKRMFAMLQYIMAVGAEAVKRQIGNGTIDRLAEEAVNG